MAINQLNKYVWLVETIHRARNRGGSGLRYHIEYGDCFEEGSARNWLLNAFSLNAMVGNSRKLKERVLLEDMPSGRNFLEDIIKAMRDNHVIFVSYYSYNTEEYHEFDIHPYFVKAFKKRWYVVPCFLRFGQRLNPRSRDCHWWLTTLPLTRDA